MSSKFPFNYIRNQIQDSIHVKERILSDAGLIENVLTIAEVCAKALKAGKKVMFAGNGGSAADAQHLAAEWVSRFYFDRPGLPSIALTTDTSILTAIGNDYGFEFIFKRQIEALGQPGDVFIGISTSGKSKNILAGFEEAKKRGIISIGMTGENVEPMGPLTDYCIHIPSKDTPRIQEGHSLLGHIICCYVEEKLYGKSELSKEN